ncbi:MAG: DUF1292 domain-containing protein [Christensenellales bacterium]|jgi:uncharacterized protein YrzB (UPF0473 family)
MQNEEAAMIELTDESGKAYRFDHLLTFEHEGEHYIAMLPIDEVEDVGEDEVMIMRVQAQNGEGTYLPIEDRAKLDEVFQVFLELWEEKLDEEDAEFDGGEE